MICKRCGRNNQPNFRYCANCGRPLYVRNSSDKNSKKKNESIIVAIIILLISVLVIAAGVLIYKNSTPHRAGFVGGGGGGSLPQPYPTQNSSLNDNNGAASPAAVAETPTLKPPTPRPNQPTPAPTLSGSSSAIAIKNQFLSKANQIEEYAENHLETAQMQVEINHESAVVYKKWDDLLNEVYQYLKTTLTDAEFKQLQRDETQWVKEKERAVNAAGAEWEGGSGEPMARNMTAGQYTQERCYYLISLIR